MSEPVIHIVDDDAAMRDSLAFLLGSSDYETRIYDGPMALLARAEALEPGCILTDVRMPDMNGLELVQELKKRDVR
ncbi:MAG TPA: response regulator, partial [Caulobacterales bacterium]|nr:response regulator [Caulobacterales bacterium]